MSVSAMTIEEAAHIMREAVRDKSYQLLPLGQEVERYMRSKRKQLTPASERSYEGCLARLVIKNPGLELQDFELPAGAELVEVFMDREWGDSAPGTYNVNLSYLSDFFKWHVKRGRMNSNPCTLIERVRKRDVYRTVFSLDQQRAIIASAEDRRDRLALRLLLHYGIRKGALQKVQFKHFDHQRKTLTIFTKGEKVRALPLPHTAFWMDLERLIIDIEAQPSHFLMCLVKPIPRAGIRRFPDRALSSTALHRWWYARLNDAGIVPMGTTSGERMHKARHSAGQRMLDATGNLKAVQKLLGHASIQTTGDVYADWDNDQLAASMLQANDDEETDRS